MTTYLTVYLLIGLVMVGCLFWLDRRPLKITPMVAVTALAWVLLWPGVLLFIAVAFIVLWKVYR